VQLLVVMRAEPRQVGGGRLAAVDPMSQMMSVDIALAMTAGKRAAAIPGVQRALEWRRHDALLPPRVEWIGVFILDDGHQYPRHASNTNQYLR
jgi:hypothetical protein